MKILRFSEGSGQPRWGCLEGGDVYELDGDPLASPRIGRCVAPLAKVRLYAPCEPSKVICAAINYWGATDMEPGQTEPVFFLKSPTSICGPGDEIVSTFPPEIVCWGEVELTAVIGRRMNRVRPEQVDAGLLGWTVANDATAENIAHRDHHLMRSKAPDTFCPVGPYVDTAYEPYPRQVRGYHNGKLVREGNTKDLFWDHRRLISWLSAWLTLEPWDLVLTASPPLVGPLTFLETGDVFVARIDGFPDLVNTFRREPVIFDHGSS